MRSQRLGALFLERNVGEVVGCHDRQYVLDVQPLVRCIDEPARSDHRSVGEPQQPCVQRIRRVLHHTYERDSVLLQPLRVDSHLHLLASLAPDRRVRDAGYPQQAGPDLPFCDCRHFDQREALRRQPDLHHPARRRERLDHHRGACPGREGRCNRSDSLRHELSRFEDVGASVEEQNDLRERGNRFGADRLELRQALERLLHRHGDELLRLFCRKPDGESLDLDLRLRELGEHIHGRVPHCAQPEHHHRDACGDNEVAEFQARSDDPAHHGFWVPLSARRRHRTPRRTVPALPPSQPSYRASVPSRGAPRLRRCGRPRSPVART